MIKKQRTPKNAGVKAAATPQAMPEEPGKNKASIYLVLLIIIILTAVALMINQKLKAGQTPKNNQPAVAEQGNEVKKPLDKSDISSLIARVASLIIVNPNEEPTIATVQDAEALRKSNPAFYKDAQNGDRLLVWSDKAVLYSPELDKLLAVMPILGGQAGITGQSATSTQSNLQATSTASDIASEKAVVEVRNGTTTPGLAKTAADLVKAKGIKVTLIGDAKSKGFAKSIIYKMSDKPLPLTLAALQAVIRAEVKQPTAEEAKGYKGDFVVIVGSDFVRP